ncbi:MAG: hypothetical protein UT33_C0012G0024 [Candidatus Peregrinibacteria bacterium GW2011_GWC2_39_14]|nr:MAG: hypothetical protein US92_C0003G0051 [Candidatus Peregrinibacteria bacterium GW2011_GWA2_38_36]KKR05219.1 MAG: hypothetical protein UT33_C0012G0024 [Candidatus Peregrinibacteria bacterium GW2011_GWC2_39_14]
MGKKSSSKKIHKGEIPAKPAHPHKEKHFKKIPMLGIVLINVIAVVFAGFVIWKYISMVVPISSLLPEDKTIAYTEMKIDSSDKEVQAFFDMIKSNPLMRKEHLMALAEDFTGENFKSSILPWLGRNAGIALIGSSKNEDQANVLVFVEVKDKNLALEFFKNMGLRYKNDALTENEYKKYTVYSYKTGEAFSFTFIGKYVVIAISEDAMNDFIDGIIGSNRLASGYEVDFSRTYVNPKLISKFSGSQDTNVKNKYLITIFDPLITIFKNTWIRANVKYGHVNATTTTELKYKYQKGPSYDAELISYFPSDIKLFYGGSSLMSQIDNISSMVEQENANLKKTMKELILFQIKDTFGDISVENDIHPLIQGEYAFAISDKNDIMFGIKSGKVDENKLKSMIVAIRKSPFMRRTIRDENSVAVQWNVLYSADAYRGMKTFGVQLEQAKWGIYTANVNDMLFVTSGLDSLKKLIDTYIDRQNTFAESNEFKNGPEKVLSGADEIFYANLYKFPDFMAKISDYLTPIKVVSIGREYEDFKIISNCIILVE